MTQAQNSSSSLKKTVVVCIVVFLFAALVFYVFRRGVTFDFRSFVEQLRRISLAHAAAAVMLIYATYLLRSWRWAVFLRQHKRVPPLQLLGTQFTGFAAVALFGRIADLSRPFLVAKKTKLPLSLQVAVYTIERMFDLGAAALIFSSALAFTPKDLPHHEVFVRVGVFSLLGTVVIAAFAIAVRVAGVRVAAFAGQLANRISSTAATAAESKVLAFRDGLNAVSSVSDVLVAALLSLGIWLLIALAYVQTTHAFVETPSLATLSFSRTMLLMGASIGGSLLQLPVLGWFTQIATTAAAMHAFYGTPLEAATACGGLLLLVTFISVIPVGMVYARIDRVSLADLKNRSEAVEEAVL